MDYFPVFLSFIDKQVLVVGGGEVACRKVDLLLKAKAKILIISPDLHPYLQSLVQEHKVSFKQKKYQSADLLDVDMVWATTNSSTLNEQIYLEATERKIWINVVDSPKLCHFITPSIVDRSPIQIAISSEGKSPVLIRYLREKLEGFLPQNLSLIADFAGEKRETIKKQFDSVDKRRRFWEVFFTLPAVETAQSYSALESAFNDLLNTQVVYQASIALIHAGKDPELLALKALRLMQQAEFVLVSSKLDPVFLELCRRDAGRHIYQNSTELLAKLKCLKGKIRLCVISESKDDITLVQDDLKNEYMYQYLLSIDAH